MLDTCKFAKSGATSQLFFTAYGRYDGSRLLGAKNGSDLRGVVLFRSVVPDLTGTILEFRRTCPPKKKGRRQLCY